MTQIVDVKAALIALLKADADVTTEVGTRVYGDELPREDTDNMERKCVVLVSSGGAPTPYASGTAPLETQRIDVYSYGATAYEAEEVRRAVYGAFKGAQRVKFSGVLIHWVNPAGGVSYGRDPNTDWPFKWDSWQVLADTRAAP